MRKRALTIIAYTFVGEWFWLNLIASLQLRTQKYMTTRQFSDYHVAHKKLYIPGYSPYYEGTFFKCSKQRRGQWLFKDEFEILVAEFFKLRRLEIIYPCNFCKSSSCAFMYVFCDFPVYTVYNTTICDVICNIDRIMISLL